MSKSCDVEGIGGTMSDDEFQKFMALVAEKQELTELLKETCKLLTALGYQPTGRLENWWRKNR